MDSIKKLLRDALSSLALATRAAMRLAGIAVPLAIRAADAVVGFAQRLLRFFRSKEVRKRAKDARKTADRAAKRGRRAVVKLANEAEARRTGRHRRAARARRWGVVGAAAAVVIAMVLYVPRRLMSRFQPETPEVTQSEVPAVSTPAAAGGAAPEPQASNGSGVQETKAAPRRRNTA